MSWSSITAVFVAVVHSLIAAAVTSGSITDINACNETRLSILVSSVITNSRSRRLIIYWQNVTLHPGEWIGLFNHKPSSGSIGTPLFVVIPQTSNGWALTDSHEESFTSDDLDYTQRCLGYWVAYITANNSTVKNLACLQTQPTWMKDMKRNLQSMKLRDIFIPGTHDSGSYKEYDPHVREDIFTKYTITQEEDILSQLIHGVRYLDIRVGYYEMSEEKWWTNHGFARIHPLQDIFDDIITFIQNTDEILIIDFHEFPIGFGTGLNVHEMFVDYLIGVLGDYMASPSLTWDVSLGEIWEKTPRLIISYNKDEIVDMNPRLWQSVAQKWGNVQSLNALYTYVSEVMSSFPQDKSWAVMSELTPTTWQVITDELGGLRNMANMVNHNVTQWYHGLWGRTVNIVAADFFRDTDLVNAAIKWNLFRSQKMCKEA